MEYHIVGGSFDGMKGRPSSIVEEMAKHLRSNVINGGNVDVLRNYRYSDPKVLIWMPKIDNDYEKMLPTIKEVNPHLLLISSKRAIETDYKESDIVGRLLKSRSNLGIMITEDDLGYMFKLLDPLGNQWVYTRLVEELCHAIDKRVHTLMKTTRFGSDQRGGEIRPFNINQEFIELVRDFGSEFSKFVNAVNPNRFLGNAATRCSYGFPAVKEADRIFVTRRNVDKTALSSKDFVEIEPGFSSVAYWGPNKPSVDAPIQLILFQKFKSVKYMLHGHVYVDGAPATSHILPCGAIEEAKEIEMPSDASNFVFNLSGHGFLALASDLDYLRSLKPRLKARPFPELGMRV